MKTKDIRILENLIYVSFGILFYISFELIMGLYFNIENILILALCILFISNGIRDMKRNGVDVSNIFICFYCLVLATNCLNISDLQKPKTIKDIYFYFVGPCIFYSIFCKIKKIKVPVKISCIYVKPDYIGWLILSFSIITRLRIYLKFGIRFLSNTWQSSQIKNFTEAGGSGITEMLMWLSIMLIPVVNKKLKIVTIAFAVTVSVLNVYRRNLILIFIYIVIYIISKNVRKAFTLKNMSRLILITLSVLIVFSIFGNYRQKQRGEINFGIGSVLESHVQSDVVNWVYGYSSINFDVLKQNFIDQSPSWKFQELTLPFKRLFGGSKAVSDYYDSVSDSMREHGLRGFNASTFLSAFIREFGYLYIFQIIILSLFVGILYLLCKIVNFQGGIIFLCMMTSMLIFYDYFLDINLLFSLLIGIIINGIFEISRNAPKESIDLSKNLIKLAI